MDQADFERQDWTSSKFGHISGKEDLPLNMPAPCGLGFLVTVRVDAEHSRYTVIQRYRTGFLIHVTIEPIYYLPNKQTSCDSFSFGIECFL